MTNLINFINGTIDYLSPDDFVDLIDVNKMKDLGYTFKVKPKNNFDLTGKLPIQKIHEEHSRKYTTKYQYFTDILGVVVFDNFSNHPMNSVAYLVNKSTKEIIVNDYLFCQDYIYIRIGRSDVVVILDTNGEPIEYGSINFNTNQILVDELDGYKIYPYSSKLKEALYYLSDFSKDTLEKNYDKIKEKYKDRDFSCETKHAFVHGFEEKCDSKIMYLETQVFNESNCCNKSLINLVVNYMYDKDNFNKILQSYSKDIIDRDGYCFYKFNVIKETIDSKIYEQDYDICLARELNKAMQQAGKTININGVSYTNRWSVHYDNIGEYGKCVDIKNINIIKYKSKILFERDVFDKEFSNKNK